MVLIFLKGQILMPFSGLAPSKLKKISTKSNLLMDERVKTKSESKYDPSE